ncbi:MAG: cellulose biosynthesis cyclic di-GMP-binding regulatory protein BcsB [Thermoleophilia bacterium]
MMRQLLGRRRLGGWPLALGAMLLAVVLPATAYTLAGSLAPATLPALQYAVAAAYALTAVMTMLEARAALGEHDAPTPAEIDDPGALAELPSVTAIVSAYLPNERDLVAETIVHLATELAVAPGRLQIILAYNTPQDLPDVEAVLASLAELNVAFTPLRVAGSRSKAQNINAALGLVRGEVTVLLDADHRPARDAAVRALRWFGAGYDIVQGRCVIREHEQGWLARLVAVEFEQIYAVSHAGRSLAFDTAMFCGTNGWWRTSVLRQIGMNEEMLTEDIDSSVRALLAGVRTVHDRSVISTELAPPSPAAWWGQRMRWAQGWFQVTLRHQAAILRSPHLTTELKLYWTYLLGWRELFPLLSLQIFALLAADVLLAREFSWFFDPFLLVTTVLTLVAGPLAAWSTYRVALPAQRRALRGTFVLYAAGSLLYTTAKNTVAIVAIFRELVGQRGWVVTRRGAAARPAPAATAAAAALLAAAGLIAAPAPGAAAAPAERASFPLAPLMSATTLQGRAPVATATIPLPGDWRTVSGTLRLRWQASPAVTPNSTLGVRIDGALLAVRALSAGRGAIDVPVASHRVAGKRLLVEIEGQLHARVDAQCCLPDPATGAIVVLDARRSRMTLAGRRSTGEPLLAELPGTLVDALGERATPLYLALPARPTGDELRAAALAAGAVARATRTRTVPIKVLLGAPPQRLLTLDAQVVRIIGRGSPRVAVRRRADGRLIVTLNGRGAAVVRAAWALARPRAPFLPGSAAAVRTPFAPRPAPVAVRAPIAPAGLRGTGPLLVSAGFRLPEARELTTDKARLELDLGVSAPAGGRIEIALNNWPLVTRNLPRQGPGRLRVALDLVRDPVDAIDHRVALASFVPGDNFLAIRADLPAGQPVGGAGDAQPPEVRVLATSGVRYASRPRRGAATLALWPWPYATAPAMAGTTVVLPAAPDESELAWALWTVAEASRWTGAPAAPRFAVAPAALPGGDVVVLARGLRAPVELPAGAPAAPRNGLLETYASGGRRLLVAYGVRALRPLGAGYYAGRVRGAAAVVGADGTARTVVDAPRPPAFERRPLPWKVPAAILVGSVLALIGLRVRSLRRRLRDLPPPPPAPTPDPDVVTHLAEWERLVAEHGNGGQQRDDAPLRS